MKKMLVLTCLAVGGPIAVRAQEPPPRPNQETILTRPGAPGSPAASQVAVPAPAPPDLAPREITVPGSGGGRGRDSAGAGTLKGVRAREVRSGQARLVLADGERTVRPGDLVGTDVVRSVEPGCITLGRPLPDGGEALVVVRFDESGNGRVRILYENDPKPAVAPAVR